jgi:hypothetical protein
LTAGCQVAKKIQNASGTIGETPTHSNKKYDPSCIFVTCGEKNSLASGRTLRVKMQIIMEMWLKIFQAHIQLELNDVIQIANVRGTIVYFVPEGCTISAYHYDPEEIRFPHFAYQSEPDTDV